LAVSKMDTRQTTVSDVFISYAHGDDEGFVAGLYESLKRAGISAWWDREWMPSRALTFHHEIRLAIDGCERVLLVMARRLWHPTTFARNGCMH